MSRLFGEAPERRVVGEYTADGEEVEEEEESGSIGLEQAEDPVSETALGCVSREVEEGGGGGGTDSGIDRTTVGSSRVGGAEGWLARLSNRLVMSNAQLIFKRLGEGQIRLSLWQGLLLL